MKSKKVNKTIGLLKVPRPTLTTVSLIVLFLFSLSGIIAASIISEWLSILLLAVFCAAYYFGVVAPARRQFDQNLGAMRMALRIGFLENVSDDARRANLFIKANEPFDYYKWRDDALREYGYYAHDDFNLPSKPDEDLQCLTQSK